MCTRRSQLNANRQKMDASYMRGIHFTSYTDDRPCICEYDSIKFFSLINHKMDKHEICHQESVVESISKLYLNATFSDLTFIVEGEKLPVHRDVLAASNEYFRALIFGGFSESKLEEIELDEPLGAFKLILQYIYTGTIDLASRSDGVIIDLLCVAHKFGMKSDILSEIISYLCFRLDCSNMFDVFTVAYLHSVEQLKEKALFIIDLHAFSVLRGEAFKTLTKEVLSYIIQRDEFSAPELDIFNAVMTWGENKSKEDLKFVLAHVRFTLLQVYELREIVEPTGVFTETEIDILILEIKTSDELPLRDKYYHRNQYDYHCLNVDNKFTEKILHTAPYTMLELNSSFAVNCMKMHLRNNSLSYSYNIDVSNDKRLWRRVVTFNRLQDDLSDLFFELEPVRYICVEYILSQNCQIEFFHIKCTNRGIPDEITGVLAPSLHFFFTSNPAGKLEFELEDFAFYDEIETNFFTTYFSRIFQISHNDNFESSSSSATLSQRIFLTCCASLIVLLAYRRFR